MAEPQSPTVSDTEYVPVPEPLSRRGPGRASGRGSGRGPASASRRGHISGRGRGSGRGRSSGRGRGSRRGRGQQQHQGIDPLGEDDLYRVQQEEARLIAFEQTRIQSLSHQRCQEILSMCLTREPSLIFDIMANPPPPSPDRIPNQPEWCICRNCRPMNSVVENKCFGHPPQDCISLIPHLDLFVLNDGVLRLARRIWNDIRAREDPPHPGEDNKQFRHAAYRQFIVWQYGLLGHGNRIVFPSCVVWRVRDRFPDPNQHYVGFIPRRL